MTPAQGKQANPQVATEAVTALRRLTADFARLVDGVTGVVTGGTPPPAGASSTGADALGPILAEIRALRAEVQALANRPERLGYRPTEAAEALGVSVGLVRNLVSAGRLKAVSLGLDGRAVVIPRSEIDRLLEEGT